MQWMIRLVLAIILMATAATASADPGDILEFDMQPGPENARTVPLANGQYIELNGIPAGVTVHLVFTSDAYFKGNGKPADKTGDNPFTIEEGAANKRYEITEATAPVTLTVTVDQAVQFRGVVDLIPAPAAATPAPVSSVVVGGETLTVVAEHDKPWRSPALNEGDAIGFDLNTAPPAMSGMDWSSTAGTFGVDGVAAEPESSGRYMLQTAWDPAATYEITAASSPVTLTLSSDPRVEFTASVLRAEKRPVSGLAAAAGIVPQTSATAMQQEEYVRPSPKTATTQPRMNLGFLASIGGLGLLGVLGLRRRLAS